MISVSGSESGSESPESGTELHSTLLMEKTGLKQDLSGRTPTEKSMLYWALVFLVIAVVAGVLGFGGVASTAASIAQVLFFIFLVVFVIALIMGLVARRPGPPV